MSDEYGREIRRRAVFGLMDYGFLREERETADYAPEPRRRTGKQKQKRGKNPWPARILTGTGLVLAVLLLVSSLLVRVRLTVLNDRAVEYTAAIQTLREEETLLRIRCAEAFELSAVEEYATGVLGMQRPGCGQTCRLNVPVPDRAEVLTPEEPGPWYERLFSAVDSFGSYFPG